MDEPARGIATAALTSFIQFCCKLSFANLY